MATSPTSDPSAQPVDPATADSLLARIDLRCLPRHIAVIMDGNGRWAATHNKGRIEGHRAGVASVREIVTTARELGLEAITLYAFSKENWRRPRLEVRALMRLLETYLVRELDTLLKNDIRLTTIGNIDQLPGPVRRQLDKTMERTRNNDKMTLVLALAYSGRAEIVEATRKLSQEVLDGKLNPEQITEAHVSNALQTRDLPDPDLLIRTSGETRISNYLLWQMAYTEFYFSPVLWPDFRKGDLYQAILAYQQRERRFGLTGEQVTGKHHIESSSV